MMAYMCVVGGYHSAVALAVMSVTQQNRIPTVFAGPWNDNITANGIIEYEGRPPRIEGGVDYVFKISPTNSMVALVVVDWMIDLGLEDVVIMAENTDYGQPAAADETALLEAAGIAVEQYDIELGTEDFVPILSRILARPEPPDAVHVLVTGETSFNLNQQMPSLALRPATTPFASPAISRAIPSNFGRQYPMATIAPSTVSARRRLCSARPRRH